MDLQIEGKEEAIERLKMQEEEVGKSQLKVIKESVERFLNKDKPLGERIKNLFKEQGVTI